MLSTTESIVSVIERRPSGASQVSSEHQLQQHPTSVEDPRKLLSPNESLIPLAPTRRSKSRDASPNNSLAVGTDRYEELIVEVPAGRRGSSQYASEEAELSMLEREIESPPSASFINALKGNQAKKVDTSYQTLGVGLGGLRSGRLTHASRTPSTEMPPVDHPQQQQQQANNGFQVNRNNPTNGYQQVPVPTNGFQAHSFGNASPNPGPLPPSSHPLLASLAPSPFANLPNPPQPSQPFKPRPIEVSIDPTKSPTMVETKKVRKRTTPNEE